MIIERLDAQRIPARARHGSRTAYDAVVIGAGPNGLGAAITVARAGLSVVVLEAEDTVGGGARSGELTLPGFVHDTASAVYPLAAASALFRSLDLARWGLGWIHPPAPLAHPLAGEGAVLLERSLSETAVGLGADASAYRALLQPWVRSGEGLLDDLLGPLRLPRHPLQMLRFGLFGLRPAAALARSVFEGERARALLAGFAAHSVLPLEQPPSAAAGLVLAIAGHTAGWPVPRGGAQRISDALAGCLRSLGGEIVTGVRVHSLGELPPSRIVLADVTPRQLLHIAGGRLPAGYARQLRRYRYGPGVFKLDWALDGPIPWSAPECLRTGTVHLGGTLSEIAASEEDVERGRPPERPFVLLAQPSLFDPERAPAGKHTAWAYCHVPNGCSFDMTERIEAQVERFAPGFRDRVLARTASGPTELELQNANLVGGDIGGGRLDLGQLFTRPVPRLVPYSTPVPGLYICSSSTPPGGGVHGLCGYFAARAALQYSFGCRRPEYLVRVEGDGPQ